MLLRTTLNDGDLEVPKVLCHKLTRSTVCIIKIICIHLKQGYIIIIIVQGNYGKKSKEENRYIRLKKAAIEQGWSSQSLFA
jgi:hypothetical protein